MKIFIIAALLVIFFIMVLQISFKLFKNRKIREMKSKISSEFGDFPIEDLSSEAIESISYYTEERGSIIDEITRNDLNLDDIFSCMNNTYSSVGEEYLYYLLNNPITDKKELEEREKLISFFYENNLEREKVQLEYAQIGKKRNISMYEYISILMSVENSAVWFHYAAIILVLLSFLMIAFNTMIGILVLFISMTINIVSYLFSKKYLDSYMCAIGNISGVSEASINIGKYKLESLDRFNGDLLNKGKKINKIFSNSNWIFSQNIFMGSPSDMFFDYFRIITHIDIIKFHSILKGIKKHAEDLEELIEMLGYIESMISIASYRKSLPYFSLPNFIEYKGKTSFKAIDLYHPLIEDAVANDIMTKNSVLITGSNASGKSTFLKSIALNAILAQTINTCTSRVYEANLFKIYTSMSLTDNLNLKESYYIVEIKSIRRILDNLQEDIPVLCFIDEVLRGTNTMERIGASSQILKNLAENNAMCFAATHDIELTFLLENHYDNYHFQEELIEEDIIFDYKIYEGKAVSRNAIKLLNIMGFDKKIVKNAEITVENFMKNGNWVII